MARNFRITPTLRNQVLDYIEAFKEEVGGDSPTYRQIGDAVGLPSTCTVSRLLVRMEGLGMIKRSGGKGSNRMIRVIGGSWAPPKNGN